MRRRLFSDESTRRQAEAILHPAILVELERQSRSLPGPYQVFVIPLLVESRLGHIVDRVLVVDCPEEEQVRRLMARDGETRESALRMLKAQASREQRLAEADDVIENDGPAADLAGPSGVARPQIPRIGRGTLKSGRDSVPAVTSSKVYAHGTRAAK